MPTILMSHCRVKCQQEIQRGRAIQPQQLLPHIENDRSSWSSSFCSYFAVNVDGHWCPHRTSWLLFISGTPKEMSQSCLHLCPLVLPKLSNFCKHCWRVQREAGDTEDTPSPNFWFSFHRVCLNSDRTEYRCVHSLWPSQIWCLKQQAFVLEQSRRQRLEN